MKKNKSIYVWLFAIFLVGSSLQAAERNFTLKSPNGKLEVEVHADGQLAYSLKHNNRLLLNESPIGLVLEGKTLGEQAKVSSAKRAFRKEHIVSPSYRCSAFDATYNELNLKLKGNYGVIFRAYDEGVAYRFYTTMKQPLVIKDEIAEIHPAEDYGMILAYSMSKKDPYAISFQNTYTHTTVTGMDTADIAFLPVTVDCGGELKMTLLESDLEGYPGLFVKAHEGKALKATFARYPEKMTTRPPRCMSYVAERANHIAQTEGTRSFPWRIWAVTEKDTEMPVNNLVYALASPNRIGDYSWIKTGKVAWDWWNDWGIYGVDFEAGINMETYKYYIDFAADNQIEFVILDEGWYDPGKGDMLTVIPELDMEELIRYGKSKGVDLILWAVFNVLDNQLEEACKKYAAMGISGFKIDFLNRDDQTAVEMLYRIAEKTAQYKLSLDLHGFYKPTGTNRTFPHIINYEGVFGLEEMKWRTVKWDMMEYDVTFPYIRMMAGPVDYTPGAMRNAAKKDFKDIYYNPVSQGTRCHQLAAYIIHDAPLVMLADNPTIYKREQECTDFIVSIPNKGIEETRILQGKLGESIVTARRVNNAWYVGGMTNWTPREISLDFSFLGEGTYQVVLFRDGVNANKQAEDYKKETFTVNASTKRVMKLAAGGGFAMSITPNN